MTAFFDLVGEPAIALRVRGGYAIAGRDGALMAEHADGWSVPVGPAAEDFAVGNRLLASGATLAELRDAVMDAGGAARASAYLMWLKRLCEWGLIEFPLADECGERAVMVPQTYHFAPALAPEAPPPEAELHRFACMRRDAGAWLVESPLAGVRFLLAELPALRAPVVRRALAAAGFLDAGPPASEERRTALAQWEFHDLLLHAHHRVGWHRDPIGGQFPFVGKIDPLPGVRPPWPGERIPLRRAPAAAGGESFASVLERRRSERVYDESRPVSRDDLGALLDRAARVRSVNTALISDLAGRTENFEFTRRTYPSGGGSYELEIYPVVDRCDGLEPGLYHYDAGTHELARICGRTPEVEWILEESKVATANMAEPQVVLAIAARFARVMWKYRAISYGVILRNTGALYQTLYLAATELGLSPCGIGSGNSALFAAVTGLDPVVEGTVGEFILGGPPRAD